MADLEEIKKQLPDGYVVMKADAIKVPAGHRAISDEEFRRMSEAGNDIKKLKERLREAFGEDYDLEEVQAKLKGFEGLKSKNVDEIATKLEKTTAEKKELKAQLETLNLQLKRERLSNILNARKLESGKKVIDEFVNPLLNDLYQLDDKLPPEQLNPQVDAIIEKALQRQAEALTKLGAPSINAQGISALPFNMGAGGGAGSGMRANQGQKTESEINADIQKEMDGFGARGIMLEQQKAKDRERK